jgi:hypothetical protein
MTGTVADDRAGMQAAAADCWFPKSSFPGRAKNLSGITCKESIFGTILRKF